MARTVATARTEAASRTGANARTAQSPSRIPIDLIDLGVTHFWDFRTGFSGANSTNVMGVLGAVGLDYLGGTSISSVYTAGEYSADLERTNTDYFRSGMAKLNASGLTTTLITVFAWLKKESTANQVGLAQWRPSGSQRGWQLRFTATNLANHFVSGNGTTVNGWTSDAAVLADTNWHLHSFTYNASTTTMTMYQDTTVFTNTLTSGTAPATISVPNERVWVGALADVNDAPTIVFDGKVGMCGVAVGTVMTAAQITTLYQLTNSVGKYS